MSNEDFGGESDRDKTPQERKLKITRDAQKFAYGRSDVCKDIRRNLLQIDPRDFDSACKEVGEEVYAQLDLDRIVPIHRTYVVSGAFTEGNAAEYYPDLEVITVNGDLYANEALANFSPEERYGLLLDLMSHETAHSLAIFRPIQTAGHPGWQHGYMMWKEPYVPIFSVGALYDEAVTDIVARRISTKLLEKRPRVFPNNVVYDAEAHDAFLKSEKYKNFGKFRDYDTSRQFVISLCTHIAEVCSTPEKKISPMRIEDAFVAGYFRGTHQYFEDVDFLDKLMGEGFSLRLRAARVREDLDRIIHDYRMPILSNETQLRILKALSNPRQR